MGSEKNLFFLAIVAAISFTSSRAASLRTHRRIFGHHKWMKHSTNLNDTLVHKETCLTSECYDVAKSILFSMNSTVDPCEDFYRFTCGTWEKYHPPQPNGEPHTEYNVYQSLVYRRVSEILNEAPDVDDILPVRQAKKLYRSCSDKERRERRELKPLLKIVSQAGGWPLATDKNDWNNEGFSWEAVDRRYARMTGYNTFYDVSRVAIGGMSSMEIIPPRRIETLGAWPLRGAFMRQIIISYTKYSGLEIPFTTLMPEIWDLEAFQEKLIQLCVSMKNVVPLGRRSLGEMNGQNGKSGIDWQSGIQNIFDPWNITLGQKTVVGGIEYVENLEKLLAETPSRTILNYVHWNFISLMAPYTTKAMMDDINGFTAGTLDVPIWKECTTAVKNTMKHVVEYLFEKKYYPKSAQRAIADMTKNIKISLAANIDNSNWLDDDSKAEVKELLRSVSLLNDTVKWYRNNTELEHFYKDLTVGTQYFENALTGMRFRRKEELFPNWMAKHGFRYQDPLETNAMFSEWTYLSDWVATRLRSIDISAALLQPPLFKPDLPESVNYGHAGFIIGHELAHGFDYDDFRVTSGIMMKHYYQKARCFIDQYDHYFDTLPWENEKIRKKSRGFRTVSENIADSTGLQAVFQTYKNLQKKSKSTERKLPGLGNFTGDQMFFISYGVRRCERLLTPSGQMLRMDDTHSPEPFRVIGTISNTDDFAKVFNCPIGSPMNPRNKCNIWKQAEATLKKRESMY